MKLSWGIRIALLYGGFVILIITMVSMAMNQKVDLVSKDYYEQELQYQEKINKAKKTFALSESVTWQVNQNELILKFPKQFKNKTIKGTVYFFRPSDEAMDARISFAVSDTSLSGYLNTGKLKRGLYKMQIDWEADNENYYNEGVIKLN